MKELWYSIKRFISNVYLYRKILWKDYQFDYGYLLDLEKFKLQLMVNEFKNSPHIDHTSNIRWMSICIKLIDIIQNRDSILDRQFSTYRYTLTKYVNINNAYKYGLEVNTHHKNPHVVAFAKDTLRQRKALYLYNKIRYNYIYEWWD